MLGAMNVYATPPLGLRKKYCSQSAAARRSVGSAGACLSLETNRVRLGPASSVALSWRMVEPVDLLDWIGLYLVGETNPFKYLDYKNFGISGQLEGRVVWKLTPDVFNTVIRKHTNEAKVVFKYYDGLNGTTKAISSILIVHMNAVSLKSAPATTNHTAEPATEPVANNGNFLQEITGITITGIRCQNLRHLRLLHCQYYAKVTLGMVHHKTPSIPDCVCPTWICLGFVVPMQEEKMLEIQVKERTFSKLTKILGEAKIALKDILDQYRQRTKNSFAASQEQFVLDLSGPISTNSRRSALVFGQLILTIDFHRDNLISVNEACSEDTTVSTGSSAEAADPVMTTSSSSDQNNGAREHNEAPLQAPVTNIAPGKETEAAKDTGVVSGPSPETQCSTSSSSSSGLGTESDTCQAQSGSIDGLPQCSVDAARSQEHRKTSRSESNLSEADVQPALATSKGKNYYDSGISQCSTIVRPNDAELATPPVVRSPPQAQKHQSRPGENLVTPPTDGGYLATPPIGRPHAGAQRLSSNIEARITEKASPKLKRPEKLTLNHFCLPFFPSKESSPRRAALVLKNPYTLCTPCLSLAQGPSTSNSKTTLAGPAMCRCKQKQEQIADIQLPSNWESRVDRHGRIFFVDHANKTTSWEPPTSAAPPTSVDMRKQIDKRYMCLRRTVGTSVLNSDAYTRSDYSVIPAVLFLTRSDFTTFLHTNEKASSLYADSASLKHILHHVRREPQKFQRYQNNKDLVEFLNAFADQSQALPPGWDMKLDQQGKTLFVDHRRKKTTFVDPRLPVTTGRQRRRPRSAPAFEATHEQDTMFYHEKVVQFMRQANIMEVIESRLPSLATDPKLRRKIHFIGKVGANALQRYSNDLDLITVLSVFESEIGSWGAGGSASSSPESGNPDGFEQKLTNFYETLQVKGYGQGPGKLRLNLRRDKLLTDAFADVTTAPKRDLQRNKLCITFHDEDGLDYGGVSREFFFLLSRELFNPYYGLFEYSANDTYTVQISPMSVFVDNYIEWFYFCGRVLGLALIHRYLIDTFFTRAFYKFLLKLPWTVSDLESLDSEFHASLQWLQDNAATSELQLTFSVNEEVAGQIVEKELVPNGSHVAVVEDNKSDYIKRMVKWRLERGVRKQATSLLRGFYEVVDPNLIRVFDARELELVLSGTMEIDIGDWRTNTEYRGGYCEGNVVITWFWQAVDRFTNAQRLRLLQFVTGTSSIPYEGFAALRGSQGPKKFTIEKWGAGASLPRAHTCFNRLDLPAYASFALLHHKLLTAVQESSGYGLE